jgi:hypothetical protein
MSVIRKLGNTTLKIAEGVPGIDSSSLAGTMALQDADDVTIGGGTISETYGAIPLRCIIPYFGSSAQAELMLSLYGLAICDGRVANGITTPDLRDRFLRGYSPSFAVGAEGGATSATTSTDGEHDHDINVFDATAFSSIAEQGTSRAINSVTHDHGASSSDAGDHTHTVTINPLHTRVIYLMRVV